MAVSPEVAEIIRRKKTQYCRFADLNQFHQFDKIALPNATFNFAGRDSEVLNENGIVYSWENLQTFCDAFTKAFADVQVVSVSGSRCFSPFQILRVPFSRITAWRTSRRNFYHLRTGGITNSKLDALSRTGRAGADRS